MTVTIELLEYEQSEPIRLTAEQASRLATAGRGTVTVQHTDQPGLHTITAHHRVGSLLVDDLTVLIRPKIRLQNLFLMLEVGLPADAWQQEAFRYATTANLLPSIVGFFCAHGREDSGTRSVAQLSTPSRATDRPARPSRHTGTVPSSRSAPTRGLSL